MVALHSEFIAGCVFLLTALLLRPDRLLQAAILAVGVAVGPLLHTKPAYSGAWLTCLLPLLAHCGGGGASSADWLALSASCLWSGGLLALLYGRRGGARSCGPAAVVCGLCWLASAAVVVAAAANDGAAWSEVARLLQCSGLALYLHRHLSASLSPVELALFVQLLRHLFPAYPLACFCLSSGLVAMDAVCRHCLATSVAGSRPIRFTQCGLLVAAAHTCAFGYYALVARLFRPATVARQLTDLVDAAALEWRLVAAWLALFAAAVLLAAASASLPLRQMTQRKLFHFLAAAAFAVALLDNGYGYGEAVRRRRLLSAAAFALLAVFLAVDTLRRHNVGGVGRRLRRLLGPLHGPRDSAELLLTPVALLVGLACPLWLLGADGGGAATDGGGGSSLAAWSGVLSVGIGDSLAGLVGSRLGRVRWPQTSRTLEGSAASLAGQLAVLWLLGVPAGASAAALAVFSVTLVEAFLAQVDNLALPLCLHFLLLLAN